ncbi:MAG: MFS transporter, partial [Actinomycetota bacterium]|nr:MFS transporter [Actinomycetota bacterium]
VGGFWFAAQRGTQPPERQTRQRRPDRDRLDWAWMVPMIAGAVCLGSLFGATEVVTVAFAEEQGHPKAVAILLAVWALGSLLAGVLTGLYSGGTSPLRRYRLGALGMATAMAPLPFIDNLVVLGAVLFLGGFAISPTMVAAMSLVEANVSPSRLTEGITWVTTGIGLGIAPGAAIAGALIDQFSASTAYSVSAVSGVLAAVIAATTGTRAADREHAFTAT